LDGRGLDNGLLEGLLVYGLDGGWLLVDGLDSGGLLVDGLLDLIIVAAKNSTTCDIARTGVSILPSTTVSP